MKPSYLVKRVERSDWDNIPSLSLHHTPWLRPNAIAATAQACHNGETLFVRMTAKERPIRAGLTGALDQVCDDSCLEFFFAPLEDDRRYFNFEFNPLGTLYFGFGAERATRVRQIVKKKDELFRPQPFETADGWGICYEIPLQLVQLYFPGYTFSGKSGANFYKCGDATVEPHYLAWAPLTSETPDYHRRGDFGILEFE